MANILTSKEKLKTILKIRDKVVLDSKFEKEELLVTTDPDKIVDKCIIRYGNMSGELERFSFINPLRFMKFCNSEMSISTLNKKLENVENNRLQEFPLKKKFPIEVNNKVYETDRDILKEIYNTTVSYLDMWKSVSIDTIEKNTLCFGKNFININNEFNAYKLSKAAIAILSMKGTQFYRIFFQESGSKFKVKKLEHSPEPKNEKEFNFLVGNLVGFLNYMKEVGAI